MGVGMRAEDEERMHFTFEVLLKMNILLQIYVSPQLCGIQMTGNNSDDFMRQTSMATDV